MSDHIKRICIKASYLLIERYHRLYGLNIYGWSKPPGNYYFSFSLDCLGRALSPSDVYTKYTLTFYQNQVGIPAWSAGDQLQGNYQRTKEVVNWLEKHLALPLLFDKYDRQINDWRRRYTVREAEAYLLTWNIAGIAAAKTKQYIFCWDALRSKYGSDNKTECDLQEFFQEPHPNVSLFTSGTLAFSFKGVARDGRGRFVDLWARRLAGESPEEIAADLIQSTKCCQ